MGSSKRGVVMKRLGCQILFSFVCVLTTIGMVVAEDLVIAPPEAPMYTLSNLRMESDNFGRSVLAVDYKLTRESSSGSYRARISGPVSLARKVASVARFGTSNTRSTSPFPKVLSLSRTI